MTDTAARSSRGRGAAPRTNAYEDLKQAILKGEFQPGEVLRETHLAQWCGVSRTPIREALQRLEQDGLVRWDGPDLTVRRRSPEEILDIYATRISLEALAARFAAERRTEHDLMQLRWALNRGNDLHPSDLAKMLDANVAFNRRLRSASHNEALIDLLDRINLHLGRYPETTLGSPGRWEQNREAHAALVDAIERRDGEEAHRIAERHLTQAREIRLALFAAEATT